MIAAELQRDLCAEVEKVLKDIQTTKASGEPTSGVTAYEQQLPEVTEDDEDPSDFFPYCIVRLTDGGTEDDDDPWSASVNFLFGVYDTDKKANGHRHILVMIQRLSDRFNSEPLLNKKFRAKPKMEWALGEEDTYPFYFGGLQIDFSVPKVGRRDPL